ncbi:NAD-dependent epimerase [Desulfatiglans anilini]|uniref:NAD-dependent epimerase n=1 Tax=Desulfatiglans anilini TaxID=90728 RepID=UPI000A04BE88
MTSKDSRCVLVTGVAGFIGFHLALRLLEQGDTVIGIDNLNEYYDIQIKYDRLKQLTKQSSRFVFHRIDLKDPILLRTVFARQRFDVVVHLAAQAGVRYSLSNPGAYIESNIAGFLNILEACRHQGVPHLVFASSSSVYGANTGMPFSVHQNVDHPVSLYAASKKSNELMAHSYAHLFGLPCTGLRFFTVYGPWGRPDMALFLFTKAILAGEPIRVYNYGRMQRDFTYIDDIIEGVVRVMERPPKGDPAWSGDRPDPGTSYAPFRVYNIGNGQPVPLLAFIAVIEKSLGLEAVKEYLPLQAGDVPATYADISDLQRDFDYLPPTTVEEGVPRFIRWYLDYYGSKQSLQPADEANRATLKPSIRMAAI